MRGLILFLVCLAGSTGIKLDESRLGSFKFTAPSGWTPTRATSRVVLAFAPPGLPAGKVCQVRVFEDETTTQAFDAWFARRWSALMSGKSMVRISDVISQKFGVIDALVRSEAYKDNGGESYALLIGISVQGKFLLVSFEANDYALIQKHQDEVIAMMGTFDLASGTPGPTGTPTGPTTQPSGQPAGPEGPIKTATKLQVPNILPAGIAMPAGDPDKAAELLGKKFAAYDAESLPALVTALRASGFTIRKPDHALVAKPLQTKGNGAYVEDSEILKFFRMSVLGFRMSAAGLCDGIDYAMTSAQASTSFKTTLATELGKAQTSSDPGVRFFAHFLISCGRSLPGNYDLSKPQDVARASITPLESFLILRSLTQSLARGVKKHSPPLLEEIIQRGPFPRDDEVTEMPGYQEDFGVDAIVDVWAYFTEEQLLHAGDLNAAKRMQYLAILNALLTTAKVLETYLCIEADFSVESPGAPLIRTHASNADGEPRTVVAKLRLNPDKWAQGLKEWRKHVAFTGLDIDMPKKEVLKNINVSWKLPDYTGYATTLDKPVQLMGDAEHSRTDAEGVAHIEVMGIRQKVAKPQSSPPAKKQVRIWVVPQMKGGDAAQDLVDAAHGGVGMMAGPIGLVTIVDEMILRSKWMAPQQYTLPVTDWTPGFLAAAYRITVTGNGVSKTNMKWRVDRTYQATGYLVPAVNTYIPAVGADIRGKGHEVAVYAFELAIADKKGLEEWKVNDNEDSTSKVRDCLKDSLHTLHSVETRIGPIEGMGRFRNSSHQSIAFIYDYTTKTTYVDIGEPFVDFRHKILRTIDGNVVEKSDKPDAEGIFPLGMASVQGNYILPGTDPPEEITPESPMKIEYKRVKDYKYGHDGLLLINYSLLIKPFSGEESLLAPPAPTAYRELPDFLKQFTDQADEARPEEFNDSAATCFPTNPGPLRSLHHPASRK